MKIIAIDLDGTLLRSDSNISGYSKEVLEKAQEEDILFVPTSGRCFRSIMAKVGDVKGVRYTIGSNGTVITECEGEKIIYEKKISRETSYAIYSYVKEKGGFYCGYSGNDSYLEAGAEDIFRATRTEKAMCDDLLATDLRVPDLGRMILSGELTFGKMFFSFIEPADNAACVEWLGRFDDIEYGYSTPYTVEIFARGSNKDGALDYLRDYLGVRREDVIAIGDSENDLAMIRYAHLGAAVANGMEVLKNHADLVIPANDEDGPAHFLEDMMEEIKNGG